MPPLIGLTQKLAEHTSTMLSKFSRADENVDSACEIYPRLGIFERRVASSILLYPSCDFFKVGLPFFKVLMGFDHVVLEDCGEELKCYSAYGEGEKKIPMLNN